MSRSACRRRSWRPLACRPGEVGLLCAGLGGTAAVACCQVCLLGSPNRRCPTHPTRVPFCRRHTVEEMAQNPAMMEKAAQQDQQVGLLGRCRTVRHLRVGLPTGTECSPDWLSVSLLRALTPGAPPSRTPLHFHIARSKPGGCLATVHSAVPITASSCPCRPGPPPRSVAACLHTAHGRRRAGTC